MTSIIKFTPLYGANSEQPLCSLIEIDNYNILLDCGWNEDFDVSLLKPLAKVAPKIDLVLISHADMAHLGALPYAFANFGLQAKVLSTVPVFRMGQLVLYDTILSRRAYEDFTTVTLDDVDACFDQFIQLKYSQRYSVTASGVMIAITPFNAGHTLGGAIWLIKRESDEIVYAVDYNHKSERHLNPSVLETIPKPTLLITDAYNSLYNQRARKERETELLDSILTTVARNGNVLLPSEPGGRTLELLMMLDLWWGLRQPNAPLILLCPEAYNILDTARSHLEWMADAVIKKFAANRENAFNLRHVRLCHSMDELKKFSSPRVVVATSSDLTPSFALELFLQWAPDPANRVIFIDRSRPRALARQLLENPTVGTLTITRSIRVPLEGAELEAYEAQQKREREAALERQRLEEEQKRLKRERLELYDDDMDLEENTFSLATAWRGYDLYADRVRLDYEVAVKKSGKALPPPPHLMFPSIERRAVFDRYGENIRVEDLKRIAEAQNKLLEDENGQDPMEVVQQIEKSEEKPNKAIIQKIEVPVNCSLQYIEFEGRSDGRAVKKILSDIAPRNLVLTHGTRDATDHLLSYVQGLPTPPQRVIAPQNGENIDVTDATDIYRIHLKSNVLESIKFQQIEGAGDLAIAYVDGVITVPPDETDEEGQWVQSEPYLDVVPQMEGREIGHAPVFVGDIKLSNLRQVLLDKGFKAEFKAGGSLLVNNTILLRRDTEYTGIEIEGVLNDDYYRVRDVLHSMLTVL